MKRALRIGVLLYMAWWTDKTYEALFKKQYGIK